MTHYTTPKLLGSQIKNQQHCDFLSWGPLSYLLDSSNLLRCVTVLVGIVIKRMFHKTIIHGVLPSLFIKYVCKKIFPNFAIVQSSQTSNKSCQFCRTYCIGFQIHKRFVLMLQGTIFGFGLIFSNFNAFKDFEQLIFSL